MEIIDPIMKWLVAPIVAVLLWLVRKIYANEKSQDQINTELKVLEARMEAQAQYSKDRHEALTITLGQVLSRLDSIDRYLRQNGDKHD